MAGGDKYSVGWLSLQLRVPVALILGGVGLVLMAVFVFVPGFQKELTFIAAVTAGAATIYSAYYAGASVTQRQKRDTQRDTMELLRQLDDFRLIEARNRLHEFEHEKVAPDDMVDEIKKDEELYNAVRATLNLFEDISVAVQHGYIDERMAYDSISTLLPFACNAFRPYILAQQQRYDDSRVYQEAVRLANAWEDNTLLSTGEQIEKEA